MQLTATEIIDEATDAKSFVLEVPLAERAAFAYEADQYCTFECALPAGEHLRCYSMSSSPHGDEPMRTTVKRVPDGQVSNWLNDTVRVGDKLSATPPTGDFRLDATVYLCGPAPFMDLVETALADIGFDPGQIYTERFADSTSPDPPLFCQAGNCATCMAELGEGLVRMRTNNVLTEEELAQGWILTCQSLPTSNTLSVIYPD